MPSKRPCGLTAPASLADKATNSGERWLRHHKSREQPKQTADGLSTSAVRHDIKMPRAQRAGGFGGKQKITD